MKVAVTCFICAIAGLVFQLLNIPIPWLLGPIASMLVAQFIVKDYFQWPAVLRNIGLIIVGLSIGQQFHFDIFAQVGHLFFYCLLVNVILMLFSVGLAYSTSRWTHLSMKTAITSTVPGGLSQLILFAEEEKDIPLGVVTYFHVVRVISVVLLVPFIVSGEVIQQTLTSVYSWELLPLLTIGVISALIGKKCKLPVAYFLGPIVAMIACEALGRPFTQMPMELLYVAQIFIGAYIGLLLKPHMLKLPKNILIAGVTSALALLFITGLSSVIVSKALNLSFATSFLSTAPGGLDQMGLLAAAVGANISVVTVFQLLRLLIIFLIVLPLLRIVYKKRILNE